MYPKIIFWEDTDETALHRSVRGRAYVFIYLWRQIMEMVIGSAIGFCVGLVCILAYRKGIRDGMGMAAVEKPAPITVPMFAPKDEEPKEDSIDTQYQNFLNYQPRFVEERHADK